MYPLKFKPVFQSRIWGGTRIKGILGKALPPEFAGKPIAESWELADLPPGTVKGESTGGEADASLSSVVTNGPLAGKTLRQILERHEKQIMGNVPLHKGHFPLLVKFLDAGSDVSVQVHPDAAYCQANPTAHLKCEAWYVLHAEPGAKIYKGVKPGVTKERFREGLAKGDVEPLLRAIPIRAGDCHYLVSGTVHALGAGSMVVEVQTPSDTTFRVFDWNRLTAAGKPRQLHVEQAMACIDFRESPREPETSTGRLVECEHFTLEQLSARQSEERPLKSNAPAVWIMTAGQAVITCEEAGPTALVRGDTVLLPADLKAARMKAVTDCAWLEAQLPAATAKAS